MWSPAALLTVGATGLSLRNVAKYVPSGRSSPPSRSIAVICM